MTTTYTIVARSQQNTTTFPHPKNKNPSINFTFGAAVEAPTVQAEATRCGAIYACGYESSSGDEYEEVEKNEVIER
ncbi:hypothetical protein Tco_0059826 [Tanacetum coccineum]